MGGVVFRFGSPFVSEVPVFFSASFASFGLSLRFVSFGGGDRWCTGFWSLSSIFVNFVLYFFSNLSPGLLIGVRSPLVSSLLLASSWQGHRFLVLYLPPKFVSLLVSLLLVWVGWRGELALMCILIACLFTITCVLLLCCCPSLNVMFWHRRWIQCTWKVKEENRRSSVGESDFTVRMEWNRVKEDDVVPFTSIHLWFQSPAVFIQHIFFRVNFHV